MHERVAARPARPRGERPPPVGAAASAGPSALDASTLALREAIERVAPTELPVLIVGETGSGKELAAEWVHRHSRRAHRPLVKVNCASLAESVVESELFGHERGAFTGAHAARGGFFEAADGGTLFLDEVGELSLRTQAKLLRVLESGELTRMGSTQARRVSVRFVAATHHDLRRLAGEGRVRHDFYFRLDGATIRVPPLRARRVEIVPLARHFADLAARALDREAPALGPEAERLLLEYAWPGNVRELRHVIERAVAWCAGAALGPEHLRLEPLGGDDSPAASGSPPGSPSAPPAGAGGGMREHMQVLEREHIVSALARAHGNQTRAAELLGVSRRTLTNKLNAHGIDRPRKRYAGAPGAPAGGEAGGASGGGGRR